MAETTPGSYESCPDGQRRFCSLNPAFMAKDTLKDSRTQGVGAGIFSNKWRANLTQSP